MPTVFGGSPYDAEMPLEVEDGDGFEASCWVTSDGTVGLPSDEDAAGGCCGTGTEFSIVSGARGKKGEL